MLAAAVEEGVEGEHPGEIAPRAEEPRPDLELVVAKVEDRIVELPGEGERPEALSLPLDPGRVGRGVSLRAEEDEVRGPGRAVDRDLEVAIPPRVRPGLALEVRPRDAARGGVVRAGAARGELPGARADRLVEARAGGELVDEAPVERAPAPHPLLHRAEEVGVVAPHLALVDDPGETARPGQDAEEGDLGEGHRARAVVDQQDPLAGEGELVAPARRRAVQGREVALPRVRARVLDRVPGLVGELAEVDLVGMTRTPEHADVGPGREHPLTGGGHHHRPDLRVLEAKALHRVVELDVDPEVVGVELELVARIDAASLVDGEPQDRDRPIDLHGPVTVAVRPGPEVHCHVSLRRAPSGTVDSEERPDEQHREDGGEAEAEHREVPHAPAELHPQPHQHRDDPEDEDDDPHRLG